MMMRKLKLTKDFTEAEREKTKLFILIPTIGYMNSYYEGRYNNYISKTIVIFWLFWDFRIKLKFELVANAMAEQWGKETLQ